MNLREALQEFLPDPVLIDDETDYWTVYHLLEELSEEELAREVYSCHDYITRLDEQGYQITPALFTICHIGETPYYVEHDEKGYQVRLMISEEQERSRPIYGQDRYQQKQAAYRRKTQLNTDWQQARVLGA
jgi:hypothetical protein